MAGQQTDQNIAREINELKYPIRKSEWQNLRHLVEDINCKKNHFHNLGYLFLGATISILLTTLKIDDATMKTNMYYVDAATFLFGILFIYVDSERSKSGIRFKDIAINQMDSIQRRFEPQTLPNQVQTKSWWQIWK